MRWSECGCVSSLLVSSGTGTASIPQARGKVLMCYFQSGPKAEVQPMSSALGTWAVSPVGPQDSHPHLWDPTHLTPNQGSSQGPASQLGRLGVCRRSWWWAVLAVSLPGVRGTQAWAAESPTVTRFPANLPFMIHGRISSQCALGRATFSSPLLEWKARVRPLKSHVTDERFDGRNGMTVMRRSCDMLTAREADSTCIPRSYVLGVMMSSPMMSRLRFMSILQRRMLSYRKVS